MTGQTNGLPPSPNKPKTCTAGFLPLYPYPDRRVDPRPLSVYDLRQRLKA